MNVKIIKDEELVGLADIDWQEFNHFINTPNFVASLLFDNPTLVELKLDYEDIISISENTFLEK